MQYLYKLLIEIALKKLYALVIKGLSWLYDKAVDYFNYLEDRREGKERLKRIEEAKKNKDEKKYNSNIDDI